MSRETAPRGKSPVDSPAGGSSPKAPRANNNNNNSLRERVNFFERIWSAKSQDDIVDNIESLHPRSGSRASNSSFEESYERVVEEGELNGAKIVKFEKITLKKSVKELTTSRLSRTPSEECGLEDSAYQSHGIHGSKSSSIGSFNKFPSEESLSKKDLSSTTSEEKGSTSSEWYHEYRNQSFQNFSTKREDYLRSKSQFDAHIAEIRGKIMK